MKTKTKWIIGISAVVLGITAFATRKKWMPKKDEADSPSEKPMSEGDSTTKSMGEQSTSPKFRIKIPTKVTMSPTFASKGIAPKTSSQYDVLADKDYDSKMIALAEWRKRMIPSGGFASTIAFNSIEKQRNFAKKYLPMSLDDIKQYSSLSTSKSKGTREEVMMLNIEKKYPAIFSATSSFEGYTGNLDNLSEISNINLMELQ